MSGGVSDGRRWHGALEGYYGAPLAPADRLAFVRWLGTEGGTSYVYAPKHDPWQRDRWREPYPTERLDELAELVDVGRAAGVDVGFVLSPGLDWGAGDEPALVAKLAAFHGLGARLLGVAFDDVPAGGADLGRAHGDAVAAAVRALPDDVQWAACPTDYATDRVTAYLGAFAAALPPHVDVMWTGRAIVSPTVTAPETHRLGEQLGRRLVLADNVPVNDGPMAGVLHLGPYPLRDPGIVAATGGVLLNLMPLGRASRIGVACGLRWWADPSSDREATWDAVVSGVPGLRPLARAARSWLTSPGPDAELVEWAVAAYDGDTRLLDFLAAGCRAGLPDDWASELAPWLVAWEWEAFAMAFVLHGLRAPRSGHAELAFAVAEVQRRLRLQEQQLFGIRHALYPVTRREDDLQVPDRAGLVTGDNLTDRICRHALDLTLGGRS